MFNLGDTVRDKKTGVEGVICFQINGYYTMKSDCCTIGLFSYSELELLTSEKE